MCDWAYHHEALRKTRVIQRKNEALARLAASGNQQANDTTKRPSYQSDYQTGERDQRSLVFRVDHPVKSRHVDNTLVDQVDPLMSLPEQPLSAKPEGQPRPRRPHFKV